MDITKKFSVLLITAITAVSLVSCGKTTKPEASSDSEVSSVINVKASAWDNLNDKEKDFYNVPLVKTQMKKIIVTAKTLYSHPKNVSKIYAALHTDLAW